MADLTIEQVIFHLQNLPKEIYKLEQHCIYLRGELDQAELDFDREFARAFQIAKLEEKKDPEARQFAVTESLEFRQAKNSARIALGAAEVELRKAQNEFVSVRKIASIKNEEMRMAGQR